MARRGGILLVGGGSAVALLLTGCSSAALSDSKPVAATSATAAAASAGGTSVSDGADPGCTAALRDVGKYGPSTVKLLAEGREAVNTAVVRLLVDGLDGAADAANSPRVKQAIGTLATAYDDYFDLSTDAVAIPLSTLLKDSVDLESVCR
jgi:hypothetical protein